MKRQKKKQEKSQGKHLRAKLNEERDWIKKGIFISMFVFIAVCLVICVVAKPDFIKDCIFELIAISVFYLVERRYHLPTWIIGVAMIIPLLHAGGVTFDWFGLLFFGIGYDKFAHFLNSFAITVVAAGVMITRVSEGAMKKIIAGMLIALGFGAINEVNEFIGQEYFGITGAGMFSQGDLLPKLESDFQVYDTEWDVVFNFAGTIFGAILLMIAFFRKIQWNFLKVMYEER